ncbi:hypothetical protein JA1_004990 [Spathaspora sp. JA1]|nr:hypothetical protein JA1_004990 [Spathaspora sp. JA1]
MESTNILRDYLMSSSNIRTDISFESFSREFPSKVSQDVIKAIFDQLIVQQEQNYRTKVLENINNAYEFPLKQVSSAIQKKSSVKDKKLNNLVLEMEKLASTLSLQEQSLGEEVAQYGTKIKLLVEELSNLRYGRKDDFYEPAIDDAQQCIEKIAKILNV